MQANCVTVSCILDISELTQQDEKGKKTASLV